MIINVILSVMLLFVGCAFAFSVLFFGAKFSKDDERLPDNAPWRQIIGQLINRQPFWMYLLTFLVFQPAIVHIINTWSLLVWNSCGWLAWIPEFTDFIAFISLLFFILLFRITDDYGRLKIFRKS